MKESRAASVLQELDHLAVIPDRCRVDPGPGAQRRFRPLPAPPALLDRVARQRPVTLHSIGLSICSAEVFDRPYVDNLAHWSAHWRALGE